MYDTDYISKNGPEPRCTLDHPKVTLGDPRRPRVTRLSKSAQVAQVNPGQSQNSHRTTQVKPRSAQVSLGQPRTIPGQPQVSSGPPQLAQDNMGDLGSLGHTRAPRVSQGDQD